MSDDYESRRELLKDISNLSRSELEELYRILRREGGEFSENSNGIFFDIVALPVVVFNALQQFISFCKSNATDLEKRNKIIQDMAQ